jgi:DNA processing protein
VVGSRNASVQGKANALAFAGSLSGAGLCIVSGLALGIDAAAHEGALTGPASTVAVIGTGPDLVYPARNRALCERIGVEGCIVSEYPIGTPPLPGNFPKRNRIISGLAAGVLVVEAAAQSGSLITARQAAEQGREVFAIPGSIHAALAKGCHLLIREGAKLVDTAADVLEAMAMSPLARRASPEAARCAARCDAPDAAPAGSDALLAALGHDPVEPDILLASLGIGPALLSSQLLALELAGMVERQPGGRVQRVVK